MASRRMRVSSSHELVALARRAAARQGARASCSPGILPTLARDRPDARQHGADAALPGAQSRHDRAARRRVRVLDHTRRSIELHLEARLVMLEACNSELPGPPAGRTRRVRAPLQRRAAARRAAARRRGNSPTFFGRRLWAETRIALFAQAVDKRTSHAPAARGTTPRVTFGNDWVRERRRRDLQGGRRALPHARRDRPRRGPMAVLDRGECARS